MMTQKEGMEEERDATSAKKRRTHVRTIMTKQEWINPNGLENLLLKHKLNELSIKKTFWSWKHNKYFKFTTNKNKQFCEFRPRYRGWFKKWNSYGTLAGCVCGTLLGRRKSVAVIGISCSFCATYFMLSCQSHFPFLPSSDTFCRQPNSEIDRIHSVSIQQWRVASRTTCTLVLPKMCSVYVHEQKYFVCAFCMLGSVLFRYTTMHSHKVNPGQLRFTCEREDAQMPQIAVYCGENGDVVFSSSTPPTLFNKRRDNLHFLKLIFATAFRNIYIWQDHPAHVRKLPHFARNKKKSYYKKEIILAPIFGIKKLFHPKLWIFFFPSCISFFCSSPNCFFLPPMANPSLFLSFLFLPLSHPITPRTDGPQKIPSSTKVQLRLLTHKSGRQKNTEQTLSFFILLKAGISHFSGPVLCQSHTHDMCGLLLIQNISLINTSLQPNIILNNQI